MAQNNFELNGISSHLSEINEINKKLAQPVLQNASALGSDKAKITLLEFADYQCLDCANFYMETRSQIIDTYATTGDVKLRFKDFIVNDKPYDNSSTLAARASYCAANQGKYWQYHDELYSNSLGENTGWVTKESLKQFARNVKVPDLMKFSECLGSQKYSDVVKGNDQLGRSIGLKSIPTFILFREGKQPLGIVGVQPFNIFQQAISQLEEP